MYKQGAPALCVLQFLPAWTMGTGLQAPLRYRLLPYRQFMNVGKANANTFIVCSLGQNMAPLHVAGIWHELGQQSNATEELVVLHGGYVGLTDKAS